MNSPSGLTRLLRLWSKSEVTLLWAIVEMSANVRNVGAPPLDGIVKKRRRIV